ncbi:hypothetical protein [Myroides odoratus]|uniref:hypothetical protein n=1 Tax=Myroides odoratus TaxID=256 RepID=UPI003342154A
MRLISFIIFFVYFSTLAQEKPKFYVRYSSYDASTQEIIKDKKHFDYFVLTPGYFLKKNTEIVDYGLLEKTLFNWFPDEQSQSYLVIDWERDAFKNLKKYSESDKAFREAEKDFITLIQYIKKKRPNLKVGIYGIPYRFNYDFQKLKDNTKFYNLLRECDFIAPSLYLSFTKFERNISFLQENLEQALQISEELRKPVVPFFWYLYVNQSETILIEKDSMETYLKYIEEFNYKGNKIQGIFWWDAASVSRVFDVKAAKSNSITKREDILKYYNLINK